ncbi:MAG: hypothetical protein RL071_155 [Pseudomonadota bacterium]
MRIFCLHRPTLPGQRAQTLQVLHTAAALARAGHSVTVCADRAPGAGSDPAAEARRALGLGAAPGLALRVAPAVGPLLPRAAAGLWFRATLAAWAAGPPGVVYARDLARLAALGPALRARGHRIVLEVHALDALTAEERGEDPAPHRALASACAALADALVANSDGTLEAWRAGPWPADRPSLRVENAADPGRQRGPVESDGVSRAFGSFLPDKDVELLLAAAARLGAPLELCGGEPSRIAQLGPPPPCARVLPAVPFAEVPAQMARAAALLLPLADRCFGRRFTNPLKLWDYLLTDRPIVAPDLPTVTAPAARVGARLHLHRPGDPDDLARAWAEALAAGPRPPVVRSWDQRAAELDALLRSLPGGPR